MDYKNELLIYTQKIEELQKKNDEAKKMLIVSETNLKSYHQQLEELKTNFIDSMGFPIEEAEKLLLKQQTELDNIMQQLLKINIDDDFTEQKQLQLQKILTNIKELLPKEG